MEHLSLPYEKTGEKTEKEMRREELENEFTYDGYQVVRKELFAHLRDPSVTVRYDSITFNAACINGLEDAVYINVLLNENNKRLVVRKCTENDVDSIRWCIAKSDKRKSRKITSREFSKMLYNTMGWDSKCRYKILGYKIEFCDEMLYVFDLMQPEIFVQRPRKMKTAEETLRVNNELDEMVKADPNIPDDEAVLKGKQGFFIDDMLNTFGLPVDEHEKAHEVSEIDGFTSMAMLTGNSRKKEE